MAYEELYVILPETGGPSPYTLAEHKDINDNDQTVNVGAPAADLVQTGTPVAIAVACGTVLAGGSLMWIIAKRRKKA